MNAQPPTPEQVLDGLVRRYAPPPSPGLPNHDAQEHAKKRLVLGMVQSAYGADHPLSKIAANVDLYERTRVTDPVTYMKVLDSMEVAYQELCGRLIQGN